MSRIKKMKPRGCRDRQTMRLLYVFLPNFAVIKRNLSRNVLQNSEYMYLRCYYFPLKKKQTSTSDNILFRSAEPKAQDGRTLVIIFCPKTVCQSLSTTQLKIAADDIISPFISFMKIRLDVSFELSSQYFR